MGKRELSDCKIAAIEKQNAKKKARLKRKKIAARKRKDSA